MDRQRNTMIKETTRIDKDLTVVIEECHFEVEHGMDRTIEEGHNMLIIIEMTLGDEILGKCKIIEVSIIDVDIEKTIEMTILEEVEADPGKKQYSGNFRRDDQRSSRSRSGLSTSTNRERIRCFKCKEYNHFTNNCPNSEMERQS